MRNRIIESDLRYITKASLPWEVFKDRTVLITGAAGLLPAYMVETFLYLNETKSFNTQVIGFVRNLEKAQERFSYYRDNARLTLMVKNVCEEMEINRDIDYIIHAASPASPKIFQMDPVGTILPNIIGTANLLKLAVKKQVKRFLFFSTSGVYGHVNEANYPIKEKCFGYLNPFKIESCYLESKRMGETMCIAWMDQYGVPVIVVRPAITYGPGLQLDDGRSFADFIASIVNHKNIELYSDGQALRNFCYIADATLGFFLVLLKGMVGEAYNVAAEHEIRIIDLAKLLVEKVFPERKLEVVKKKDATKEYTRMNFSRTAVDVTKLKALGWKYGFPLEEGFKRTVESFQNTRVN